MMYYNIHTHESTHKADVVELINQYPNEINLGLTSFSVGIHPWYLKLDSLTNDLSKIEEVLNYANCKAIGECGLDKRIETSIEDQKKALIPQLLLAEKYKKPVVLHCVSAYQEIIEIKKDLKLTVPMIIHGFSKNIQVATSLLKNDFYLSFGKYLLLNPDLGNVLNAIPKNRIFLETDMMEHTIYDVYNRAEEVLQIDVKNIIEENYKRVFNP